MKKVENKTKKKKNFFEYYFECNVMVVVFLKKERYIEKRRKKGNWPQKEERKNKREIFEGKFDFFEEKM